MLNSNSPIHSKLGLKHTLFNQGGGSGSFYQGDGGAGDDDSQDESSSQEHGKRAICPPIDPQTIELMDISELITVDD